MNPTDEDTRMKILIIDDESSFYDSFCDFTRKDWNIDICETKKPSISEVINLIKSHQISAIVSDLKFSSDFNFDKGIEFVKELYSEIEVPIIVITNDNRFPTQARVLELGISGFFEKSSFNREEVKTGIEQIVQDYSKESIPSDDLSLLIEYFLADSNVCPPQYKQFWNKKTEEVLKNSAIEKIEKCDWRNDIIGFKSVFRQALLKAAHYDESQIDTDLICNLYQKKKKISKEKQIRRELEHVEYLLNHHSRDRKAVEAELKIERGSLSNYVKERHLAAPSVFDINLRTILDSFNISCKIQQKLDIVFWYDENDETYAELFLTNFEIIKKSHPVCLFAHPLHTPLVKNRLDYLLEKVRNADFVFLFLSPNALKNNYFSELINKIYTPGKLIQHIPIIAEPCNWRATQLVKTKVCLPVSSSCITNSRNPGETIVEIAKYLEDHLLRIYGGTIV